MNECYAHNKGKFLKAISTKLEAYIGRVVPLQFPYNFPRNRINQVLEAIPKQSLSAPEKLLENIKNYVNIKLNRKNQSNCNSNCNELTAICELLLLVPDVLGLLYWPIRNILHTSLTSNLHVSMLIYRNFMTLEMTLIRTINFSKIFAMSHEKQVTLIEIINALQDLLQKHSQATETNYFDDNFTTKRVQKICFDFGEQTEDLPDVFFEVNKLLLFGKYQNLICH